MKIFLLTTQTGKLEAVVLVQVVKWTHQRALGFKKAKILSRNPCSSSIFCKHFGLPFIKCHFLRFTESSALGFEFGFMVSHCFRRFRRFLPSDLFISKASSVSTGRDACADDWSKVKRSCFPGCAASNIWMVSSSSCRILEPFFLMLYRPFC
jgi:hypothetical protein